MTDVASPNSDPVWAEIVDGVVVNTLIGPESFIHEHGNPDAEYVVIDLNGLDWFVAPGIKVKGDQLTQGDYNASRFQMSDEMESNIEAGYLIMPGYNDGTDLEEFERKVAEYEGKHGPMVG